ncbi:hypothetical protein [Granulibacter bethesdensis]|uniref:Secreted protein n=1 Tax=Granulibacter bethesdensis (strain ATCC BAA-1260 / CGDNIH1) TaxID=391165 RepID=A0A286M343_GRABC|nr:hypothetical protein [Granulibacter bethesdensis]APH52298.1 Hypothetical protein GbCGDNIH5_7135 [Granulibacter bethesdensis]APH64992.1 Hypothetical protein GbCGDNIH1I4_7135 [Granulibacter bethesdensis]ASV62442.1 Hypothetical protein GbCGDNIH1_7135 [Granulibacter bethesdensis CGDNIH1]
MINLKHLCSAFLIFCTSLASIPASADVWDPKVLEQLRHDLLVQRLKEREEKKEIERKQTPKFIKEMKRKYSLPPGPYHELRGKNADIIIDQFWDEIKKKHPDFRAGGYVTINDNGDWFSCIGLEKILKNGVFVYIEVIKSSNGWVFYSNEVAGNFWSYLFNACNSDGEIVE